MSIKFPRFVDDVVSVSEENSWKPIFQGDVMIKRIKEIPSDAKASVEPIIAHSETGHHHVVECANVFTTADARTLFFSAIGKEDVSVVHLRPTDTHKTLSLPAGKYMVRRSREHTPEGWRITMD